MGVVRKLNWHEYVGLDTFIRRHDVFKASMNYLNYSVVVIVALLPDRQNSDGFFAADFVQSDVAVRAKRNDHLAKKGVARNRFAKSERRCSFCANGCAA